MTPADVQAAARALAVAALWFLVAALALCTVAAFVQAAIASFEAWCTGRRYRRALADANAAADRFDRAVRAGVPIIPPPGPLPVEAPFPRPLGAWPPLDS